MAIQITRQLLEDLKVSLITKQEQVKKEQYILGTSSDTKLWLDGFSQGIDYALSIINKKEGEL